MRLRPGHAVYRKSTPGLEPVPMQFLPVQNFRYPPDNSHTFERWYLDTFVSSNSRERIYLPIQWTAFYCNNRFGHDKVAIQRLQGFINKLPTDIPYYTIVQFDDGILNDISHLDIKVFSMGGGRVDYPIPLLCMPHRAHTGIKQDVFASFIGKDTHVCRKDIMGLEGNAGYYISNKLHSLPEYTRMMQNSIFSLTPRGYGSSSFRICEAIHAGSIPVYYSDKHCIPYNMPFNYGLCLRPGDDIDENLRSANQHLMIEYMRDIRHLFTYTGCKDWILKTLKDEA